ncbi:hypothetical protein ACWOFR_07225 [Carnobacterium gallinarum]|uniref:hypothetical protein n=1 Tax=Carnobacterium gallinarum TaxID=2749 RepID=UPI00068F1066|nr:hypothetical protein [Carnobacterium gallinarum]
MEFNFVSNNNSLDLFKQVLKLLELTNEEVSGWLENSLYNNTNECFYSKTSLEGWNGSSNGIYYWNPDEDVLRKEKENVLLKLNVKDFDLNNPMKNLQIASYLKMIYELRQHTVQYDHIAPLLHRIESRVNDFSKVFKTVPGDEEIFNSTVNVVSFKNVNQDMKMMIPMIIAKMTYEINRKKNND